MLSKVRGVCGICGVAFQYPIGELILHTIGTEENYQVLCHKCCKSEFWDSKKIKERCLICSERNFCQGKAFKTLKANISEDCGI